MRSVSNFTYFLQLFRFFFFCPSSILALKINMKKRPKREGHRERGEMERESEMKERKRLKEKRQTAVVIRYDHVVLEYIYIICNIFF